MDNPFDCIFSKYEHKYIIIIIIIILVIALVLINVYIYNTLVDMAKDRFSIIYDKIEDEKNKEIMVKIKQEIENNNNTTTPLLNTSEKYENSLLTINDIHNDMIRNKLIAVS